MGQLMRKVFLKQREDFEKSLPERERRFTLPDGVIEENDISYINDDQSAHRLDVYRPAESGDQELPVIVNVHGGGLIIGCKEFNRYFCAKLCKLGYIVFNVEYWLVPDCQFFDQCRDVFAAMEFIDKSLDTYHGIKDKVYAVGDSGGACLLTYAVAMQNSGKVASAAKIKPSTLKIQALGLISGMFYTHRFDKIGLFLPKYLYGGKYKKSSFAPYVNPEHPDVIRALPPCFLVTSEKDHLKHYTVSFEKALTRERVPHYLLTFPKDPRLTHAFSVFEPFYPESDKVLEAIVDFFGQVSEEG